VNTDVTSLADARTLLGAEAHGQIAHIPFKPELINISRLSIDETMNPNKMHQVPSAAAEQLTIDDAITQANAKVGDDVTIPVFGRKAITKEEKQPWQTVVYDLQGRYIPLTIDSEQLMHALTEGVSQFAFLQPAYVKVKLTKLDEYAIAATAVAVVSVPNLPDNSHPPTARDFSRPVGIQDGVGKANVGDIVIISLLSRTEIVADPLGGKMCEGIDYDHAHITLHLTDEAKVQLLAPIPVWETGPYYLHVKLTKISKEKIEAIPLDYLE
jgi:hypothetical protein